MTRQCYDFVEYIFYQRQIEYPCESIGFASSRQRNILSSIFWPLRMKQALRSRDRMTRKKNLSDYETALLTTADRPDDPPANPARYCVVDARVLLIFRYNANENIRSCPVRLLIICIIHSRPNPAPLTNLAYLSRTNRECLVTRLDDFDRPFVQFRPQ